MGSGVKKTIADRKVSFLPLFDDSGALAFIIKFFCYTKKKFEKISLRKFYFHKIFRGISVKSYVLN